MARRGTALVPTLINVETFPGIADGATRYPTYAAHMRALHAGATSVVRRAVEAGVPVYAGTDAGGGIAHGRIVDEIEALHAAGHPDAAGRGQLGGPGLAGPAGAGARRPRRPAGLPIRPADRPRGAPHPRTDPVARPPADRRPLTAPAGGSGTEIRASAGVIRAAVTTPGRGGR